MKTILGISLAMVMLLGSVPLGFSEPLKVQLENSTEIVNLQCDNPSHVLVIRTNGNYACVTEKTALKTGWQTIKPIFEIEETDILPSDKTKEPIVEREFLDTVYSQKSLVIHPSRMESIGFTGDWCGYDYSVYDGKYNQLWIQVNPQDNSEVTFDREIILTYLATADFLYEEYSDLF